MRKTLGLATLVAAIVGVIAVVWWVSRQPTAPIEPDIGENGPGEIAEPAEDNGPVEVSGGEIVRRDEGGEVIWRATFGGTITVDEQERTLKHTDVLWELQRGGIKDLSIKAPVMEADYDSRMLTFSEGVDIQADDGQARFVVDEVRYEFDTEKLISDGQVAFMYGGFTLRGSRLVIDNRAQKVRVSDAALSFE